MALESSSFLDEMPSHDFVVCTDDEETQHRGDMNDVVYDMLDDLSVNDEEFISYDLYGGESSSHYHVEYAAANMSSESEATSTSEAAKEPVSTTGAQIQAVDDVTTRRQSYEAKQQRPLSNTTSKPQKTHTTLAKRTVESEKISSTFWTSADGNGEQKNQTRSDTTTTTNAVISERAVLPCTSWKQSNTQQPQNSSLMESAYDPPTYSYSPQRPKRDSTEQEQGTPPKGNPSIDPDLFSIPEIVHTRCDPSEERRVVTDPEKLVSYFMPSVSADESRLRAGLSQAALIVRSMASQLTTSFEENRELKVKYSRSNSLLHSTQEKVSDLSEELAFLKHCLCHLGQGECCLNGNDPNMETIENHVPSLSEFRGIALDHAASQNRQLSRLLRQAEEETSELRATVAYSQNQSGETCMTSLKREIARLNEYINVQQALHRSKQQESQSHVEEISNYASELRETVARLDCEKKNAEAAIDEYENRAIAAERQARKTQAEQRELQEKLRQAEEAIDYLKERVKRSKQMIFQKSSEVRSLRDELSMFTQSPGHFPSHDIESRDKRDEQQERNGWSTITHSHSHEVASVNMRHKEQYEKQLDTKNREIEELKKKLEEEQRSKERVLKISNSGTSVTENKRINKAEDGSLLIRALDLPCGTDPAVTVTFFQKKDKGKGLKSFFVQSILSSTLSEEYGESKAEDDLHYENSALKTEIQRWKQRVSQLMSVCESYQSTKKTDPVDTKAGKFHLVSSSMRALTTQFDSLSEDLSHRVETLWGRVRRVQSRVEYLKKTTAVRKQAKNKNSKARTNLMSYEIKRKAFSSADKWARNRMLRFAREVATNQSTLNTSEFSRSVHQSGIGEEGMADESHNSFTTQKADAPSEANDFMNESGEIDDVLSMLEHALTNRSVTNYQ